MYFDNQPIILDFDRFIDYVGKNKSLELTNGKGELRNADLLHLNDRMHFRLGVVNDKAKQNAFPLLHTFFHIGCVAELFQVKTTLKTKKKHLTVSKERVSLYDAMSDDEKYFFLLETFWCYVDWGEAYDSHSFWDLDFYKALLNKPVGKVLSIASSDLKREGMMDAPFELFLAEIFEAFGFYALTWDENISKRSPRHNFPYKSVVLSEIGKTMLPILLGERSRGRWGGRDPYWTDALDERVAKFFKENPNDMSFALKGIAPDADDATYEQDEEDGSDSADQETGEEFETAFLPLYKDLTIETRLFPIERPFVGGNYTLRVALDPKCYRDIAIAGSNTLGDLHNAIQHIFDFDDDHLYAFYLGANGQGRPYDTYADTRGGVWDGENPADVFRIGELGLYIGRSFRYLFDFGDNWKFSIEVLDILTGEKELKKFKLLQAVGENPKQYEYDDDEWE